MSNPQSNKGRWPEFKEAEGREIIEELKKYFRGCGLGFYEVTERQEGDIKYLIMSVSIRLNKN